MELRDRSRPHPRRPDRPDLHTRHRGGGRGHGRRVHGRLRSPGGRRRHPLLRLVQGHEPRRLQPRHRLQVPGGEGHRVQPRACPQDREDRADLRHLPDGQEEVGPLDQQLRRVHQLDHRPHGGQGPALLPGAGLPRPRRRDRRAARLAQLLQRRAALRRPVGSPYRGPDLRADLHRGPRRRDPLQHTRHLPRARRRQHRPRQRRGGPGRRRQLREVRGQQGRRARHGRLLQGPRPHGPLQPHGLQVVQGRHLLGQDRLRHRACLRRPHARRRPEDGPVGGRRLAEDLPRGPHDQRRRLRPRARRHLQLLGHQPGHPRRALPERDHQLRLRRHLQAAASPADRLRRVGHQLRLHAGHLGGLRLLHRP